MHEWQSASTVPLVPSARFSPILDVQYSLAFNVSVFVINTNVEPYEVRESLAKCAS